MSPAADLPPADLVTQPPARIYKRDGRSVVWRVDAPAGAWVVKRFEAPAWRQALARWLGLHPAQRERRMNRRLIAAGIDVVPIDVVGRDAGRVWLATRARGTSVQELIARSLPEERSARDAIVTGTIGLWDALRRGGWFFRDFQVANIVVDDDGRALLIDVGGTRRSRRPEHARRMLRQLLDTARAEGLPLTDAWRGARRVYGSCPEALPSDVRDRLGAGRRGRR